MARPKEYGEVNVATGIPGAELLQEDEEISDGDSDLEGNCSSSSDEVEKNDVEDDVGDNADQISDSDNEDDTIDEIGAKFEDDDEDENRTTNGDDCSDDDDRSDDIVSDSDDLESCSSSDSDTSDVEGDDRNGARKRKFTDFDHQLDTAKVSLRALKKLTAAKFENSPETDDCIYSNEDFQRIKELQVY